MDLNEGTVQCELYRRLRNRGYRCLSEPTLNVDNDEAMSRKRSFLNPDMAVLNDRDDIVLLIEVKSVGTERTAKKYSIGPYMNPDEAPTKQIHDYACTDYPVFVCRGWDDIDDIVSIVEFEMVLE